MKRNKKDIKNELAYFYKVIKNMVHVLALPVAEEASAMNRKKYRAMRSAPSKNCDNISDRESSAPRSGSDTGVLANRKRHRELQMGMSKATMPLTEKVVG